MLARGGLPVMPPAEAFAPLRGWVVAAYVASLVLVHVLRAVRWRHLLRPVGRVPTRSVLAVSWIAFAAILLAPLRSGEVVRPYLVTRRGTVRIWEAAGTIAAERVVDGLVMATILFVALRLASPIDPLPERAFGLPVGAVPGAAHAALALFAAAFAAMAAFFWRRELARRATRAVLGLVSTRLAESVAGAVERVAEGLRFLPSPRHLVPFLLETLGYWAANAGGLALVAWGAGLEGIGFAEACVVMGCIGLGVLVPAGPGFFGAFQLSAFLSLAMFLPEAAVRGPGAAFVFVVYVAQVGVHLGAAGAGLLIDPDARR